MSILGWKQIKTRTFDCIALVDSPRAALIAPIVELLVDMERMKNVTVDCIPSCHLRYIRELATPPSRELEAELQSPPHSPAPLDFLRTEGRQ